MTDHTPGPWTYRRALQPVDGEYDYAITAVIAGEPDCIAEAFGRVNLDIRLGAEANARLIAAAPDLLAALEASDNLVSLFVGPDDAIANTVREMARAAIARAKETP